ncbi:MAG: hypothetical protein AAF710_00365 [Planctomycetota bacterium]
MIAETPHGHWHITTLIAALGLGLAIFSTLVDGPVNGDLFQAFVE